MQNSSSGKKFKLKIPLTRKYLCTTMDLIQLYI